MVQSWFIRCWFFWRNENLRSPKKFAKANGNFRSKSSWRSFLWKLPSNLRSKLPSSLKIQRYVAAMLLQKFFEISHNSIAGKLPTDYPVSQQFNQDVSWDTQFVGSIFWIGTCAVECFGVLPQHLTDEKQIEISRQNVTDPLVNKRASWVIWSSI